MLEVIKSIFYGVIVSELVFLFLNVSFCESKFFDNLLYVIYFIITIAAGFLFSRIINLYKISFLEYVKTFEKWTFFQKINFIAVVITVYYLIIFLNSLFLREYQIYCISNYNNVKILFFTGGILGFEMGVIKKIINLNFDNFFNYFICLFIIILIFLAYEIELLVKISVYYVIVVILMNLLKPIAEKIMIK